MLDKHFMPWIKLNGDRIEHELQAQNEFIPVTAAVYPLSLNSNVKKKKRTIKNLNGTKRFIPGKVYFPMNVDSRLTKLQQAVCLKVLKIFQSGCNVNLLSNEQQNDLKMYKSLQTIIQEEHVQFLDYVKTEWQNKMFRREAIGLDCFIYAYYTWENNLRKSLNYPQFYKCCDVIRLAYEDPEHLIKVLIVADVLSFGTPPTVTFPTFTSEYILPCQTLPAPDSKSTDTLKISVSQDKNIENILGNCDVDVVISMSGIKRLMDDSGYINTWSMPFSIKQCKVKSSDGRFITKNIVYIDKPLPPQWPTKSDLNFHCHKRLVKINLCDRSENVENQSQNETDANDLINFDENVLHSNVTYSIWSINRNDDANVLLKTRKEGKNIKFLLRHKTDACEETEDDKQRPVTLVPKLEYQLEHGASIATKNELIRQWADLMFRPYSHLYRVRMQANSSEVVHIESVSLQKLNNEAMQHYQYKPYERLGALFTVFSRLVDLECGNYLLHHNNKTGAFAEIWRETTNNTDIGKMDLHKEYDSKNCGIKSSSNIPWCPIDVNYIMPAHDVFKRMPGMFKPLLVCRKNTKGGKKKGKKAKKKKQEKKNE